MDRIHLDCTNLMADVVGAEHGIAESELEALAPASAAALESVRARRTQDLRWLDLPYQEEVLEEILGYAAEVQGRFENVVVLGIGGSALGNLALSGALSSPYQDVAPGPGTPRLFVLDNVDPDLDRRVDRRTSTSAEDAVQRDLQVGRHGGDDEPVPHLPPAPGRRARGRRPTASTSSSRPTSRRACCARSCAARATSPSSSPTASAGASACCHPSVWLSSRRSMGIDVRGTAGKERRDDGRTLRGARA